MKQELPIIAAKQGRSPLRRFSPYTLLVEWQTVSWLLPAIILLSVLLRVGSAFYHGNEVVTLPGVFDQLSYTTLARRVLDGHGFTFPTNWWPLTRAGEPTAHWSYPYTFYLTLIYGLLGPHPLIARLVQAIIVGIFSPWLTYRIGSRLFGKTVGIVAAGITSCYIYFIYYAGALMTEAFYITALLWTLDTAQRIVLTANSSNRMANARKQWIELAVAISLAALLRQLFLLFIPFLFIWLLLCLRSYWSIYRVVSGFALVLLIISIFILPFTVYNYIRFDRIVLLNTNAGYAFFWANHPIYDTTFVGHIDQLPGDEVTYTDLVPQDLRHLDEAALEQALLREGLQFVVQNPTRYIQLSLSRIPVYFKFWPSGESDLASNIARVASFGLLLPFMLYGLLLSLTRRIGSPTKATLPSARGIALLYLFIAVYTIIHLLSWTQIRYRLPVDAILVIFAAVAIVDLSSRLRLSVSMSITRIPSTT